MNKENLQNEARTKLEKIANEAGTKREKIAKRTEDEQRKSDEPGPKLQQLKRARWRGGSDKKMTDEREQWLIFRHEGRELFRYTIRGTFPGEREETINLLAYENGIQAEEIICTIETRTERRRAE